MFLSGHPGVPLAVTVRPPELGPKCLTSRQCRMLCFTPCAHSTVRQGFLTFYILCAQSPGSDTGPHALCSAKGWHQLSASCLKLLPPRTPSEALPAAAQGATSTDAATSYLLLKNRHLPIQQLLYSRIKTVSMLLLFSQCFCIVVTCLTCLCSVCNLSLTAHMDIIPTCSRK